MSIVVRVWFNCSVKLKKWSKILLIKFTEKAFDIPFKNSSSPHRSGALEFTSVKLELHLHPVYLWCCQSLVRFNGNDLGTDTSQVQWKFYFETHSQRTFQKTEPITTIMEKPEMFIDASSTINQGSQSPNPLTTVLWTHSGKVIEIKMLLWFSTHPSCVFPKQEINYDSPRGGVSVVTEKGDVSTSYLLIQRAK